MKKIRMFFIATILLLSTLGVLAGRAYFITGDLFVYQPPGYHRINFSLVSTINLTTVGIGIPCNVTNNIGIPYALYINTGMGGYQPLYSLAW